MPYKLENLFSLKDMEQSEEILEVIRQNTMGPVYLLGGAIYRQITSKFWNTSIPPRDFDFVAAYVRKDLVLPDGWIDSSNSYGSHKLHKGELTIDLWSKEQQYSIVSRNLPYTIKNILRHSPLTIQSIAFDMRDRKVISNAGIEAIKTRTVGVHCLEQAQHYCGLKHISVNEFILSKASALGFQPLLLE